MSHLNSLSRDGLVLEIVLGSVLLLTALAVFSARGS